MAKNKIKNEQEQGIEFPVETPNERLTEPVKNDIDVTNIQELIAEEKAYEAYNKFYLLKKSITDFSMEIEQAIQNNGDIVGTKYVLDKLIKIIDDNQ